MESTKIYVTTLECSSDISGYYRYSDVFQIFSSKRKKSSPSEYFMDIEYNEKYINSSVFDDGNIMVPMEIIKERAHLQLLKEIVSLLCIAMDEKFKICGGIDDGNIYPQEIISKFSEIEDRIMIGECESRLRRSMRDNDFVRIAPNAEMFFRKYFALSCSDRDRYNSSSFLYKISQDVSVISASLSVVSCVSAVENLMDFDAKLKNTHFEHCSECSQPRYRLSRRFKDFMMEYSYTSDLKLNENKLLTEIYSLRSSITHLGNILNIDKYLTLAPLNKFVEIAEIQSYIRHALFKYLELFTLGEEAMESPISNP
ncbi:hypothetical protein [Komagataeibacter oboediens]|uniref:hypothetical protein n=1 Tax=Komagataeibacter oboediens TaxID=65958 RepID=UPI001903CC81|nr:hypothetical protein [Komagataeibacter oboediens]GCE81760.1 hypothetical protein MSKU3_3235 [Komagataeibacter oboediens]